jgi:hypothetical protein
MYPISCLNESVILLICFYVAYICTYVFFPPCILVLVVNEGRRTSTCTTTLTFLSSLRRGMTGRRVRAVSARRQPPRMRSLCVNSLIRICSRGCKLSFAHAPTRVYARLCRLRFCSFGSKSLPRCCTMLLRASFGIIARRSARAETLVRGTMLGRRAAATFSRSLSSARRYCLDISAMCSFASAFLRTTICF